MARRAGYERRGRGLEPEQPAPINTAADAEESLSLDYAKAKLAAAKTDDEERRKRHGEEHAVSKAGLTKAQQAVDAAKLRVKEAANREKTKRLPALIAEQQRAERERLTKAASDREAARQQYAERIKGWCTIIVRRQGALNDVFGKNHERWEECAQYASYEATPKHWPVELRLALVKAAKIAVKLLDHCLQNSKGYSRALDLAGACARFGPPSTEFERQREMMMISAVADAGNGWNWDRTQPLNRPTMDWIQDPHIKQQDWALTEEFAKIFEQGAAYSTSHTPAQDGHSAIEPARQRERAAVKEEVRQKALQERERPPIARQTHGLGMYDDPTI